MNLIRVGVGRKLLGGLLLRSGSIRPRLLVTTTMIGGRQRATPEDVVDLTGEEDVDRPADKRARTRTHPPRSSCLDTSLPFQLFRTRGIPAEYNDEQQGLGFDMEKAVAGEIKFAFVSNYLIDPIFLVSTFPDLLFCDTVVVAHGMKDPSQHEMLRRALTSALVGVDVSVVAPTVPEYGTHHSKVFVLQYERGIRIVIHTANLVYPDFCNKAQSVFYQDFPLKTATQGEGDEGDNDNDNADDDERPQNDFEAQLLSYVDHLSLPAAAASQLKDVISAHDYTYARGRLAVSVPSKPWEHKDGDYMAFGHHRVRKILQEERAAAGFEDWYDSAPVVAQGSSLGSLSAKYIDDLKSSFAPGSSKDDVALELIWPTVSEVQHAIDGWFGGGSVCATSERVNKAVVREHLHKWGGEVTGRQRALPHMKTYLRYARVGDKVRLPWVFLSSMNTSKAALGEAVNSKKYGAQLFRVLSFEMGIVLLPRYELAWRRSAWFGWSCTDPDASGRARARAQRKPDAVQFVQWSKSAAQPDMDEGSTTLVVPIPLPFSLPPRPYPPASATDTTPADGYQDIPWSQPTELANAWHGKDMLGNLYPGRGSYQGLVQKGTSDSLWWEIFSSH